MSSRIAPRVRRRERLRFEPMGDLTVVDLLEERSCQLGYHRKHVDRVVAPPTALSRWDVPEQLPGTGMLSAYEELAGGVTLVRLVRSQPDLMKIINEASAALVSRRGRPRQPGNYLLLMIAWVDSGEADAKPFYDEATTQPDLWRACGFEQIPAYKTMQRRFVEVEQKCAGAFEEVLCRLVQRRAKADPRIGAWVVGDPTMVTSNARPHRVDDPRNLPARIGSLPVASGTRLSTETVDEIRRGYAALPEDADPSKATVAGFQDLTGFIKTYIDGRFRVFTTSGGQTLVSLDPDAGYRVYKRGGRVTAHWWGYLVHQPVCHFTGMPLLAVGFGAHHHESRYFDDAVDAAERTTGRTPFMWTADMAYSTRPIFEKAVLRGMTLVAPYKPRGNEPDGRAQATIDFDEQGIPLCRHCRIAGTDQVGFVLDQPKTPGAKPRAALRVKCAAPSTPQCHKEQEISCLVDARRLLPVWRTHPAYTEARQMHQNYERSHKEARSRYNAAPRHFETRSKRISLPLVVLRANIGAMTAWLRASVINGWLGNPPLNPELDERNHAIRQAHRNRKIQYVNFRTMERRLRNGRVGGGRYPPRPRARPPSARRNSATS